MKTILVDAIGCLIDTEGNIFKDMQLLLDKFENKKIILTSADYKTNNSYNLNDTPYEVFTLKHNPEKTDPNYYKKMLEYFRLNAEDVIYFEHDKEAAKSAKSVGIKTSHYSKDKKDLVILENFLNDNL
ncbi:MAG TPA: hypothetical protein P5232_04550 [Candidatus Moranbacteria bacterium]|nr:hypothetical protein [Candidatus Moranbacteria bacterium]